MYCLVISSFTMVYLHRLC